MASSVEKAKAWSWMLATPVGKVRQKKKKKKRFPSFLQSQAFFLTSINTNVGS